MGPLQTAGIRISAGHLPQAQTLGADFIKSTWPVYLLPGVPYTYKQYYSVAEDDVLSLTRNTV